MSRSGASLALLLLGGFRTLADAATAELQQRGFEGVRPGLAFSMRAILEGARNTSELARRMSVSKQAAAKTIGILEERAWVRRAADPQDARSKRLQVTPLGLELLQQGEAIFERLRDNWIQQIGREELERLEATLLTLVGSSLSLNGLPGWSTEAPSNRAPPAIVGDRENG